MKCLYDRDRKAFYVVPVTAADRQIIQNDFGMTTAGDFVMLVRQDVLGSDNQLSHLEVSKFLYTPPRAFSTYEFEFLAANPNATPPDRNFLGTRHSAEQATRSRRTAIQAFIAGLAPLLGDVVILPLGTNPVDPDLGLGVGKK